MENKTPVVHEAFRNRVLDMLYEEDDFLMGRKPVDLENTWEEEE